MDALIQSDTGILAVLSAICAFFFWLERRSQWKVFEYLPPLIFIYLAPLLASNLGLISIEAPVYGWLKDTVLPMMLVILLLDVNVKAAFDVMGKGIFVMLFGTLGIVIGAPIAFLLVKSQLGPDGWKAFGTLAGSWTGGTGNMAAVSEMIGTEGREFGLAVLADTLIYIVWLPILLGSKRFAGWFNRFAKVDANRVSDMAVAAAAAHQKKDRVQMVHMLYLIFIGLSATWVASEVAEILPTFPAKNPIMTASSWKILIISTLGISLSFTKARLIPGSHQLAMALVYLFVANMGAKAQVAGMAGQAFWFLMAALVWIFIHGGFCLLGAKIFKVDVHSAAIASAANIGGAASAPVVAAYHMEALVPASILMALIGYAVGNYAAFAAAMLCRFLA